MSGSILELIIYLAAAAILTVVGIQNDIAKKHSQMLAAEGVNEAAIVGALGTYSTEQSATLLAGHNGGDTLTAPTLAQLNLKNSFATGPFWGGEYVIALTAAPADCTVAAGNCHVAFQFYPSVPYKRVGVANVADVAQIVTAANAVDAQFGYSSVKTPATISGINGAWSAPNPLGSAPATIMATNNGGSGDSGLLYIRRDGSLIWTGDQNAGGVSITNLNNVQATGAVSAASLNITGGATVGATINATGAITSSSTIQPGAVGVPRASCTPLGAQATNSDGRGQPLSCENLNDGNGQVWIPVGGPTQVYNFFQVVTGSTVPAPSCFAGGTPEIRSVPQTFQVDTTAAVNFKATGAGPWTITVTNGSGSTVSNVNGESIGSAVAETYCSY